MAEIERREPIIIAAGDSLIFQRHLLEFPRSKGWSLQYVLVAMNGKPTGVNFVSGAPADGSDDHLVNVPNFAAAVEADEYVLAGYASNATSSPTGGPERHQIYRGELMLVENLPSGAAVGDQTTHAQRMVKLLEIKLERLETYDFSESDVQRTKFVIEERTKTLDRLKYYREYRNYEIKTAMAVNTGCNQSQIVPEYAGGW